MTFFDAFRVDLPECDVDGIHIEKFDTRAPEHALNNLRYAMEGRGTQPGVYTMLVVDGVLWMSDTNAEARDHMPFYLWCQEHEAKRVLVNGLGMGCIVHALLSLDSVERIDIVELQPRVIEVIGAHYAKDPRVHITQGDAFEQMKAWPKGVRWDAAWHDIWPDLCEDNIEEMDRLQTGYRTRVKHQESWSRAYLMRLRRSMR